LWQGWQGPARAVGKCLTAKYVHVLMVYAYIKAHNSASSQSQL